MPYALIGDVVASRRFADARALVDGVAALLEQVNDRVVTSTPLALVVRDEFHGLFARLHQAVEAALRLRLVAGDLVPATLDGEDEPVDVRIGIGQGVAAESEAGSPHGSAWRNARDARDAAQELPGRTRWPPSLRTVCRADDRRLEATVNAFLLCQDQLLARMDARDRRALTGLLDGERQVDVAADLGVTQPAIARRMKDRGALALARSLAALDGVDP